MAPTAPYTLLCAFQPCKLHGLRAQLLITTGYLITTTETLLEFSQMTPKKTSAVANAVAATPNPASDRLATPLCLPCIRGCPSSEHPATHSMSVPAAQAAGNPLSCPVADSASRGAVCQHMVPFPIWASQCTWGEQPGSTQSVN